MDMCMLLHNKDNQACAGGPRHFSTCFHSHALTAMPQFLIALSASLLAPEVAADGGGAASLRLQGMREVRSPTSLTVVTRCNAAVTPCGLCIDARQLVQ
jgi:hypothetical protein